VRIFTANAYKNVGVYGDPGRIFCPFFARFLLFYSCKMAKVFK